MPKIVYANIIWFLIVMVAFIISAVLRHESELWSQMADVRRNYDILYVGLYGVLFLVATVGLITRNKLGYDLAMGFNYILAVLALIPVIGLAIYNFKNGLHFSIFSEIAWLTRPENIISLVSIIFIVLMKRKNVLAAFGKM